MAIVKTEILSAIQARLVGDATLIAIVPVANIGNRLPQDTSYPHLRYQIDGSNLGVKSETAYDITLQIDFWSDYKGSKEVLQIEDALENALDGTPLTIASADCFGTSFESFDSLLEPDGEIYRGTAVFQLLYGAL